MTDKPETKVPPYVGYVTFINFLNGLASSGLPARIDNSLMRNQSGGTQSSLLATLRYLNLMRKDGTPTQHLVGWVAADEAHRKRLFAILMKGNYPFLAADLLDLTTATPQLLDDALRTAGATSGTLEKARTFFLAAAKDVGIEVSAHITKGRQTSPGSSAPRKARAQTPRKNNKPPADETDTQPTSSMVDRLLAKFPDFNPEWGPELQAKWFAGFDALMAHAGIKPEKK